MTAPTSWQRWVARHSRVIVTVCLVAVAVLLVVGVWAWVVDGWRAGIGPVLSTTGFLCGAYGARACRRYVADYDERVALYRPASRPRS